MNLSRKVKTLGTKGESDKKGISVLNTLQEIKSKFQYCTEFKDGYAIAVNGYDNIVIIDENWNEIVTPYVVNCSVIHGWKNGYIVVHNKNTRKDGIFDKDLQRVSECEYYRIEKDCFGDGYIKVITLEEEMGKLELIGVLNSDIKCVVSCGIYHKVIYLGNDIFVGIKPKDNTIWGEKFDSTVIDTKDGKENILHTVNGKILRIDIFEGKKYYYFVDNYKYGYYDENFELFIKPEYEVLEQVDEKGECIFIEDGRSGKMKFITREKIYRKSI